jgi:hypothetical protein
MPRPAKWAKAPERAKITGFVLLMAALARRSSSRRPRH